MATMNNNNIFTCSTTAFQLMEFAKQIRKEEYNAIIKFIEEHPGATIDEISFGTGIEHDSIMGMLNNECYRRYYGSSLKRTVWEANKEIAKKEKRISRKFREIDSNGNLMDNTIEIVNTKRTYYIKNQK